jgi:LPXTG-motif cell wall-anchored protein
VPVVKVWKDEDNAEGLRPESIIVNLYADGELVATQEITANDEWKFVFENLAKFDGEEIIEYTLTENEVDEYYTEITGNYIDGFVITNIIEEEITDNPPPFDSPKTGDATVLFELLGFAAVAVGSILVIRTRKSRKQMI